MIETSSRQRMESLGRLTAGIAHDFGNLVTVILGFSEMLLKHAAVAGFPRDHLEDIHKAAERAAELTHRLVNFSRQRPSPAMAIGLNVTVAEMERMLRPLLRADISLQTCLDPGLGAVRAGSGEMEQLIMNLILNARDALPQGGVITLETRNIVLNEAAAAALPGLKPGPHVLLVVRDTGLGMDESVQTRLFEAFFTTKEEEQGAGLGLAIVHDIVDSHAGTIEVASEPGAGSSFRVYLPQVEKPPAVQPPQVSAVPDVSGRGETLLLVEDCTEVRSLVREILTGHGYQVLEAHDYVEAVTVCEQFSDTIHLLLTDVTLPVTGGPELAQRLTHLHPAMRVMYMSGYGAHESEQPGPAIEDALLLLKPFTPFALLQKVREILGPTPPKAVC